MYLCAFYVVRISRRRIMTYFNMCLCVSYVVRISRRRIIAYFSVFCTSCFLYFSASRQVELRRRTLNSTEIGELKPKPAPV